MKNFEIEPKSYFVNYCDCTNNPNDVNDIIIKVGNKETGIVFYKKTRKYYSNKGGQLEIKPSLRRELIERLLNRNPNVFFYIDKYEIMLT